MNLDIVRERSANYLNKKVVVHVYGMRNKSEEFIGIVSGVYPYVFTVVVNGSERSFNYSDVIIGDIVVNLV